MFRWQGKRVLFESHLDLGRHVNLFAFLESVHLPKEFISFASQNVNFKAEPTWLSAISVGYFIVKWSTKVNDSGFVADRVDGTVLDHQDSALALVRLQGLLDYERALGASIVIDDS